MRPKRDAVLCFEWSGETALKIVRDRRKKYKRISALLEGNPASDIVKFAQSQEIDLIVIATHGLTGIKHLLLGSVAEKVVRMAPCPVFTVKVFGKSLVKK